MSDSDPSTAVFQPRYVKHAHLLLKGVRKFLKYKRDVIAPARLEEIESLRESFAAAVADRDADRIDTIGRELTAACEGAVPPVTNPGLRENIEVIFVAVVIAVGIRTYFLQPFKIPTGSMQPTLNGIIGYGQHVPGEDGEFPEQPGALRQAFEYLWYGRNYVDVRAPADDRIVDGYEATRFRFFTFSYLRMASGRTIKIYAPLAEAHESLGLDLTGVVLDNGRQRILPVPDGYPVREGQVIARGYIDTGDQVLVDKVSYHFRRPERGEVFVFNTKGIRGIENSPSFDPAFGSQHYIKRLAGVPGDHVEIREPELWINGRRAEEPGFVRVMEGADDEESAFNGYQDVSRAIGAYPLGEVRPREYLAMGDNSFHSFDSRMWGPVPEENLVGPALVVYWPFGHHFGPIR